MPTPPPPSRPAFGGALAHTLRDIPEEAVDWLWPGWIPAGMLTCVDGDGGVGKSTVLIDLMARLTRGNAMPDGTRPTRADAPCDVLLVACEDALRQTVKGRVQAAGADEARFHYVEEVRDRDGGEPRQVEFPRDVHHVERVIGERGVRLVVIDPVLAFLGGADYGRDTDVRAVMGPLKRAAEGHGCAIVYVRHWNKGSASTKAVYRGNGSLAFTNVARAGVTVGRDPSNNGVGVWAHSKGNLAPAPRSLAYRTVGVQPGIARVEWVGPTDLTADDLAAGDSREAQDDRREAADASELLLSLLSDGQVLPAAVVAEAARSAGLSPKMVRRAREQLGVKSKRMPGDGHQWCYQLPSPPPTPRARRASRSATP